MLNSTFVSSLSNGSSTCLKREIISWWYLKEIGSSEISSWESISLWRAASDLRNSSFSWNSSPANKLDLVTSSYVSRSFFCENYGVCPFSPPSLIYSGSGLRTAWMVRNFSKSWNMVRTHHLLSTVKFGFPPKTSIKLNVMLTISFPFLSKTTKRGSVWSSKSSADCMAMLILSLWRFCKSSSSLKACLAIGVSLKTKINQSI